MALAASGQRPAYHALGLGALAANVALVDRWLVRAGLPPSRRLAGLLLVFTGGGLGGVLALVASPEVAQTYALDLYAGLYPFLEVIGNPHCVVGTTLLVSSLSAFALRQPSAGAFCSGPCSPSCAPTMLSSCAESRDWPS
jgi:hypothetical protein